ncbi:MAG TPA: helix-turn-helix domain-containing protein [Gaiellaceae bacterium]
MRCRSCQPLPEGVARAADLLGRRWVLAILWASSEAGAVRFNEFKQALETIPPRTLAARLQELEQAGILERRVLDARPPRVEYRLTVTGDQLASVAAAVLAVPLAVLRRQHSG